MRTLNVAERHDEHVPVLEATQVDVQQLCLARRPRAVREHAAAVNRGIADAVSDDDRERGESTEGGDCGDVARTDGECAEG